MKRSSCFFIFCLFFACISLAVSSVTPSRQAFIIPIQGGIGPATASFVREGFTQAQKKHDQLIILQMDTPGGLSTSMRDIIQAILTSTIPVVVYIAPSGARAASAGTYILYASHIAAMAPGTNLGAATPVAVGGFPTPTEKEKTSKSKEMEASKQKAINDARAYLRSLAQMRKRNASWAEKAVTQASTLTAEEALKKNVIDVVAKNIPELLAKINNRVVEVDNKSIVLNTQQMTTTTMQPNWRIQFLSAITNPSVAYILLMIGFYGLFFEFINPGFIVPGVVGAICLVTGLYALQLLPINYAGLILIVLGLAFIVSEAFVPSFGALGIGGGIAFVMGSILLFRHVPGFGLPIGTIASVIVFTAAFVVLVISLAWRSKRRPIVTGREALLGKEGRVEASNGMTVVRIMGERWQCRSETPLAVGDQVKVIKVEGLILWVDKVS